MKRILFFVGALLMFGATDANAQSRKKRTNDSLKVVNLDNIVVSATRVNKKVPVAYSNVAQAEIYRNSYGRDIASLLQFTPSMIATSDAGNGIGYTDIRLRGTDGTRINVTANGVPMNDAESHKVYWVDTPDLISSVGSLQIQRGVGSSTNGAGAFGGSINLTTSAQPTQAGAEASFSYGSYTTNKEAVKVSTGLLGGHWAIDGRFSHIYSHGYMDRAFSNLSSYMAQVAYYDVNTVWKFISFGGHERTYNAWDGLSKSQMEKYGRTYNPCGEITDADGNVTGFYQNQTDNYTQINNQLVMNHIFNEHWNWNVTAHYTRGNGYYNQWKNNRKLYQYGLALYDASNTLIKKSALIRKKQMANDFYGFVSSANYKTDGLMVTLGAAGNLYNGDHWGNVTAVQSLASYADNHEYYRNYARKSDVNIFAKATWEVTRGLNIYGDLQYRHISHQIYGDGSSYQEVYDKDGNEVGYMQKLNLDKSYEFVNPKIGLSYTNGAHNAYFSFGMAQKEPTRDDFVNAMDVTPTAETLYDWEAGYQFTNNWLTVGVNLYWMQYKDQLILTGAINTETYDPLYFNAPKSYRRGVELNAMAKVLPCLSIGANATFSENRIKDYTESIYSNDSYTNIDRYIGNTDIAYSPDFIGNAVARFEWGGFEAGLNVQHVGKQYINNSSKEELSLDAYTVGNFDMAYTFHMKGVKSIRVGVNVNNIFNSHYCANAYVYDASNTKKEGDWYDVRYFPQATRNFLANVTFSF